MEACFLKKIFLFKSSYICVFFVQNQLTSVTQGWLVVKSCHPLKNSIFDVLSISFQYTLSFKWPNFGLKCLVTITSKGESLKFIPFLKQTGIVIHLLSLSKIIQLLLWSNKERKSTVRHVIFEPVKVSAGI